jgi:hypothetical protein
MVAIRRNADFTLSYRMRNLTAWRRVLYDQVTVTHLFKPEGSLARHLTLTVYPNIVIASVETQTVFISFLFEVSASFFSRRVSPTVEPTALAIAISCSYQSNLSSCFHTFSSSLCIFVPQS